MMKPKFLMMIATAGLALSLSAQAQDIQPVEQNQAVNSALDGAKSLFGSALSFGKSAVENVVNSQPAQQIKGAASDAYNSEVGQQVRTTASSAYNSAPVAQVKSTASELYNGQVGQQVRGTVSSAYQSEPVTQVKAVAGSVYSAGKTKISEAGQAVSDYKQNALADRGLNEGSSNEQKSAAYGNANAEVAKNFFGNLLNKTKEITNTAVTTVQQATEPIGESATTEQVSSITPAAEVTQNVQKLRTKTPQSKNTLK